jgi:proteasome lid subunit RPN8/RPN11
MQSLTLTQEGYKKMIAHIESQLPLEACGLLAGNDSKVEVVFEVTNQAQSPVRFMMDPIEQLNAFEWIDSKGMELVGIFHSHPTGPETISPTDIAEAAYAVVHIVLARVNGAWRARGFWIEDNEFREVPLQII